MSIGIKQAAAVLAVAAACGVAFAQGGGTGSTNSASNSVGSENKDATGQPRPGAPSASAPVRHHRAHRMRHSASAPMASASGSH